MSYSPNLGQFFKVARDLGMKAKAHCTGRGVGCLVDTGSSVAQVIARPSCKDKHEDGIKGTWVRSPTHHAKVNEG